MKRASMVKTAQAILEFNKRNLEENNHLKYGCRYGQPDGPDDFINECECYFSCTKCGDIDECPYELSCGYVCQSCFIGEG